MPVIRGDLLPVRLQQEVLAKFVHRWTHENARQTYKGRCPACAQAAPFPYVCGQKLPDGPKVYTEAQWHAFHAPIRTDEQWLCEHAFRVSADGKRLLAKYAESASMADFDTRR